MSTRPCPNCGVSLAEQSRFCGQCGTTITSASEGPDVHEEVTVARDMPNLSAMKTILDALPMGSGAGSPTPQPPAFPTPLVPAPETQAAPVVVRAPPAVKTMMLSKTMNDPDVQERAAALRDAVLGSAPTTTAAPVAPSGVPKANLNRTMMMGGETAPPPQVGGGSAPTTSDRPTSPPAPLAPALQAVVEAQRPEASPLSKSVLGPQSWHPPGFGQAPPPNAAPPNAPPPNTAPPNAAPSGGVDVGRVVSLGGPPVDPPAPPAPPPAEVPAPVPVPAPAPTPRTGAPALRTMLGMAASDLGLPPAGPGGLGSTIAHPGAPVHPGAQPAAAPFNVQKTMLGVAIPGIAPTHGGSAPQGGAPSGAGAPQGGENAGAQGGSPNLRSQQSTMLGVAIPGIAPTHATGSGGGYAPPAQAPPRTQQMEQRPAMHHQPGMPSQVQNTALGVMAPPELKIVPRPRTLIDEPLPVAPQIPQKRGVPAVAVVGILFFIVLVAGGGIAYFALRNGGALTAIPQLDENGRESLKIGCPSCPDGTTVSLGASKATVTASAAVLPLPAPLSIGDNDLSVRIERPAGGRNEDVKVHVPVAYRVRADLSTLSARPPAITVRVEATPGSTVTVDEKPITLDATGRGSYAIDLSTETDGEGEAKTFERKIPFAITPKGGKAEGGQLTARTSVVPLGLDAPGKELITEKGSAAVSGQTRAGSTLTIDGQNVPVDAQGRFGVRVELSAMGDKPLEIVASAPPLAPRIMKVKVTRVASLEAAAKGEDAQNPLTYDVYSVEPDKKVGQKAVVEGEVVEARTTAGHTVLLIEDKKKCAKGASCLVRVGHGDDTKIARGDTVRAYGRILGPVTANGKTYPDLDGLLVLPLKTATK